MQEKYIPYSQRHGINPENKFSNVLNYLERVIGVDIENQVQEVLVYDEFCKVYFKNHLVIFIDEFSATIFTNPQEKPQIMRVMAKLPTPVFLNVYQTVLSGMKDVFFESIF